jgi:hypothetical protein
VERTGTKQKDSDADSESIYKTKRFKYREIMKLKGTKRKNRDGRGTDIMRSKGTKQITTMTKCVAQASDSFYIVEN